MLGQHIETKVLSSIFLSKILLDIILFHEKRIQTDILKKNQFRPYLYTFIITYIDVLNLFPELRTS